MLYAVPLPPLPPPPRPPEIGSKWELNLEGRRGGERESESIEGTVWTVNER